MTLFDQVLKEGNDKNGLSALICVESRFFFLFVIYGDLWVSTLMQLVSRATADVFHVALMTRLKQRLPCYPSTLITRIYMQYIL